MYNLNSDLVNWWKCIARAEKGTCSTTRDLSCSPRGGRQVGSRVPRAKRRQAQRGV